MSATLFAREPDPIAVWREFDKGTPRLVELADKHYTRQKPGTNQACRPGKNLCLLTTDGTAGWINVFQFQLVRLSAHGRT